MSQERPLVHIYTDGACSGNPGPGGWAALLRYGAHEKVLTGAASQTTNNRMELRAAVEGLRALKRPCRVVMHTDSEYLQKGISQWIHGWVQRGWRTSKKQPVKNRDLWQALLEAQKDHDVEWSWLKGHAGHELNERVDQLAVQVMKEQAAASAADLDETSQDSE